MNTLGKSLASTVLVALALLTSSEMAHSQPSIYIVYQPPFGNVAVGSPYAPPSKTLAMRIYNFGSTTLHVSGISHALSQFAVDLGTFTVEPWPADFHDVMVTFTPSSATPYIDTLLVASDDPFTPVYLVGLSGTGIAPPPPMSGTRTVGTGGNFATLAEAFDSVNISILTDTLKLLLTDASYDENELLIQQLVSMTSPPPLMIMPAPASAGTTLPNSPASHVVVNITRVGPDVGAVHIVSTPNVSFDHITFNLLPGDLWEVAILVEGACPGTTLTSCDISNAATGFDTEGWWGETSSLSLDACNLSSVAIGISTNNETTLSILNSGFSTTDVGVLSGGNVTGDNVIQGNAFSGNGTSFGAVAGNFAGTSLTISNNDISGFGDGGIVLDGFQGLWASMSPRTVAGLRDRGQARRQSVGSVRSRVEEARAAHRANVAKHPPLTNSALALKWENIVRSRQVVKHLQGKTRITAANPIISITGNIINSPGFSESGIFVGEVIQAALEILNNSVASTDGMNYGILTGAIDQSPGVNIGSNTIRVVERGIVLDGGATILPGGSFAVNSNDIESFSEGITIIDINAPLTLDVQENIVHAVEPAGSPSVSKATRPTGAVGLLVLAQPNDEGGGTITITGNDVRGYSEGIHTYGEVYGPFTIGVNNILDADVGIYFEGSYGRSLAIDGNTIDFTGVGIQGDGFEMIDPELVGGVSISSNTFNDNNVGAEAAIVWGYANGYSLAVDNNTLLGMANTGLFFDTFEGLEIFSSSAGTTRATKLTSQSGPEISHIQVRERLAGRAAGARARGPERAALLREKWSARRHAPQAISPDRQIMTRTPAAVSFANNHLTHLGGDGSIFLGAIINSNVSILDNTLTAVDVSPYGVYFGTIDNAVTVDVERNTIHRADIGILNDGGIFIPAEDMGAFIVKANTIESVTEGLWLGEVYEPSSVDVSQNTIHTFEPVAVQSASKLAMPTGDAGLFMYYFFAEPLGGPVTFDDNDIQGYSIGIDVNVEVSGPVSISDNQIDDASMGIVTETMVAKSLTVNGNAISAFDEVGIEIPNSALYDEAVQGGLKVSHNTIDNLALGGFAAIHVGEVLGYYLEVEANVITGLTVEGILVENFNGLTGPASVEGANSMTGTSTVGIRGRVKELAEQARLKMAASMKLDKRTRVAQIHDYRKNHPVTRANMFLDAHLSIVDNSVSHGGGGDGSILLFNVNEADVEISGNTTSSVDGSSFGIFIDGINQPSMVNIQRNDVSHAYNGIGFISADFAEGGLLIVKSNTITCYEIGLYMDNVYEPLSADISDNIVQAVEPRIPPASGHQASASEHQESAIVGIEGIYFAAGSSLPDGSLTMQNNRVTNFDIGAEMYLVDFFAFNVTANILTGDGTGIYFTQDDPDDINDIGNITSNIFSDNLSTGGTFEFTNNSNNVLFGFNRVENNGDVGLDVSSDGAGIGVVTNNLFGNGSFDLRNSGPTNVTAWHNWWGASTTAEMAGNPYPSNISKIRDEFDDALTGFVTYSNWLSGPIGSTTYGSISGKKFDDLDGDCVQDGDEIGLANWLIRCKSTALDLYTMTDAAGNYAFNYLIPGEYTVSEVPKEYWEQTCPIGPGTYTETITAVDESFTGRNFGNKIIPDIKDLSINVSGSAARPGFDQYYWIWYTHKGTASVNATVTFTHPEQTTYLPGYTYPASTTYNAASRKVTWDLGTLNPGDQGIIYTAVQIAAPPQVNLGDVLTACVSISPEAGDAHPADNNFCEMVTVVGSFDPNEKTVIPAGAAPNGTIELDQELTYVVQFQNTGTDTAFNIVVRDTLDSDLDISTLELVGASHPYTFGLSGQNMTWTFADINLVDSLHNEPLSHGSLSYSIKAKPSTPYGSALENRAGIYFDFNAPVMTNSVQNVIGTPVTIAVRPSWNIVSSPADASNDSVTALFPGALSVAYQFEDGYDPSATIENGTGYWLKFLGSQNFLYTGDPVTELDIPVAAGWNIVGSINTAQSVNDVGESPSENVVSFYYGYDGGYYRADSIVPGKGYWIKTQSAGLIHLGSAALSPKAPAMQSVSGLLDQLNSLRITDRDGNSQTLYFGDAGELDQNPGLFELPPTPPAGVFDARFSTQRFVDSYSLPLQKPEVHHVRIQGAAYPLTLSWKMAGARDRAVLSDAQGGRVIGKTDMSDEGSITISNPEVKEIVLMMGPETELPRTYALSQNYPNPFNPTTIIRYQLPQADHVTLKIFNLLGQEIRTLVDEYQEAGFKSIEWNAASVPTGVYFYQFRSGSFTDIKKMMLVR